MDTFLYEYKNQKTEGYPFKFIRNTCEMKQPVHRHDYIQIAYVMKGVCNHYFQGKSLTVGQGDMFIIPPGSEHCLRSFEDKEYEMILIDFTPFLLRDEMESFSDSIVWKLQHRENPDAPTEWAQAWVHIGKDKQPLVEQLFLDIQEEFENREQGYEYSTRISLIKLLLLIDRESRKAQRRSTGTPVRLQQRPFGGVIQYICDNYGEDIPLEKAAELAGMTSAYFSHAFKKETGQSFVEFVHEVRIERAMELIRQGVHSMTQICFQVGFRHVSHFIRTFKKRTGITPTDYKKTFAGGPALRPITSKK
ncbi:AraC family transcriptional regulator [Paenibacillus koleovorans]|uniref:AraC family transcriptional regulator n=1 Tax=Paenibacillus koleovorans TaxID=121608 RepID=UPI0013E31887|nr:AraC family transcriptional regulator [Paenibacillus koleovorans]